MEKTINVLEEEASNLLQEIRQLKADAKKCVGKVPWTETEFSVTEVCPNCESEITMVWNVKTNGYKAYCPVCGERLMLCDECTHSGPDGEYCGGCDYDTCSDSCKHNRSEKKASEPNECKIPIHEHHDVWIDGFRVTVLPWVDGKTIYCNVQALRPGQPISAPPVWEKTVYITDNYSGRDMVENHLDSLVDYIANEMPVIPAIISGNGGKIVLTF